MESVNSQTHKEFQYIIIDGGSTDGSINFIEENDDHFDYWVSEIDDGVYQAMNKGIAAATGEYLLFLNSGDHFNSKTSLENAVKYLGKDDLVYFDLKVIENKMVSVKKYPAVLSFSYFVQDTLPHPATFIRSTAFAKAGTFKEDFKISSDWKFFIDCICKHHMSYVHVDEILSVFHIGGLSSDPSNYGMKMDERQSILNSDYKPYLQDINDIIKLRNQLETLKSSRIINGLVRLGFLNKF